MVAPHREELLIDSLPSSKYRLNEGQSLQIEAMDYFHAFSRPR